MRREIEGGGMKLKAYDKEEIIISPFFPSSQIYTSELKIAVKVK